MNELTLWKKYQEEGEWNIIQLENKDHVPVGSLDLSSVDLNNFILLETKNISEKYLLKTAGISIFFTYFRHLELNN